MYVEGHVRGGCDTGADIPGGGSPSRIFDIPTGPGAHGPATLDVHSYTLGNDGPYPSATAVAAPTITVAILDVQSQRWINLDSRVRPDRIAIADITSLVGSDGVVEVRFTQSGAVPVRFDEVDLNMSAADLPAQPITCPSPGYVPTPTTPTPWATPSADFSPSATASP